MAAAVPGPAADAARSAGIEVGSLVCSLPGSGAKPSAAAIPGHCPLLVVAVDRAKNQVRVIGPGHLDRRHPLAELIKVGDSRFSRALLGATDTTLERMVPGPNRGTLTKRSAYALVVAGAGGSRDTLYEEEWPPLAGERELPTLEACLDSLQAGPFYGLLQESFAPAWNCRQGPARAWRYDQDSARTLPDTLPAKWDFRIRTLAKPNPHQALGEGWIFLEGGEHFWIWRAKGGQTQVLRAPFMDNSEIINLNATDMDGDSHPELLVEARTDYGDGFYQTLYILQGRRKMDRPRFDFIEVTGSSGEAGGSTVASEWWIQSPRLYFVSVQEANDSTAEGSHDLWVAAYRFTPQGQLQGIKGGGNHVVLFGSPTLSSQAQAWCDSHSRLRPEARKAGLRALPRLTPSGIRWQPGIIAPDSRTAKAWAKWDRSGKVMKR